MVHLLLLDLPLTYSYRVVFMRRNLLEVVRSQDRMLQRLNRAADDLPKQRLLEIYQAQVDKVLRTCIRAATCFMLFKSTTMK